LFRFLSDVWYIKSIVSIYSTRFRPLFLVIDLNTLNHFGTLFVGSWFEIRPRITSSSSTVEEWNLLSFMTTAWNILLYLYVIFLWDCLIVWYSLVSSAYLLMIRMWRRVQVHSLLNFIVKFIFLCVAILQVLNLSNLIVTQVKILVIYFFLRKTSIWICIEIEVSMKILIVVDLGWMNILDLESRLRMKSYW
jgi:hypothetical protein